MSRLQFKYDDKEVARGVAPHALHCSVCGAPAGDHVFDFEGDRKHAYCPTPVPGPIELHEEKSALTRQVGGAHYKDRAIQPIEYCHKNKLGPCESAVVKYITRWQEKGGLQDLEKAKHYIDLLIDLEGLKQNVGADHGQTHSG